MEFARDLRARQEVRLLAQQAQQALAVLKQNPDYSGAFVRAKKITVYDW